MSNSPIPCSKHICPQEVALWLLNSVIQHGRLRQGSAAAGIRSQFGEQFLYLNENGHWAISKPVLRAFKAVGRGMVVWNRRRKRWDAIRPQVPADFEY
jgi:hypothetical protein